jgi:hypothetical protein
MGGEVGKAGLGDQTYRDDQHAAQNASGHNKYSAGEEDQQLEFLAKGEARFE